MSITHLAVLREFKDLFFFRIPNPCIDFNDKPYIFGNLYNLTMDYIKWILIVSSRISDVDRFHCQIFLDKLNLLSKSDEYNCLAFKKVDEKYHSHSVHIAFVKKGVRYQDNKYPFSFIITKDKDDITFTIYDESDPFNNRQFLI